MLGSNVTARACGSGDETQTAFELAARDARAEQLTKGRFDDAQFFSDAELEVEIALVNAFELDVQGAAFDIECPGGVTGHTVDHECPEIWLTDASAEVLFALQPPAKARKWPEKPHDSFDIDGATSKPRSASRLPTR